MVCCMRCLLYRHCSLCNLQPFAPYWMPRLGASIRFGEAINPGPLRSCSDTMRFCMTNPTSLANKSDTYAELLQSHQCDFVSCSETSATAKIQWHFAKSMRKLGMKTLWSPPVPPLRTTVTGQVDGRGQASGVAAITKLCARPSRIALPDEWATTTRFLHVVAQVGESHIQITVLSCRPTSNQQAVSGSCVQSRAHANGFATNKPSRFPCPCSSWGT